MFNTEISYHLAFVAGLVSFFTPCVLPMIPAYFTFITGFSLDEITVSPTSEIRIKVIVSTMAYVLGFSTVFILMGASASFLGGLIFEHRGIIINLGSIFIIAFGLHLTGLIKISWLNFDKRLHFRNKPLHFFGTFLVGMAFAAGWSPCIGPLLGSILIAAGSRETIGQGILLLSLYSMGLALPFVLLSIFINFLLAIIKKTSRAVVYINLLAGGIMIIIGVFMLSRNFIAFAWS